MDPNPPRRPISALIELPEPGRLGASGGARRLAGRSEAVADGRRGPLGAAMTAAAPRVAALCGLERLGSAGASRAGRGGRGRPVAVGGGLAGPRRGRSDLRPGGDLGARRTGTADQPQPALRTRTRSLAIHARPAAPSTGSPIAHRDGGGICLSAPRHARRGGAGLAPQAAPGRQYALAVEALPQPGAARLPSSCPSVSTLDTGSRCLMRVGAGGVRRLCC